jgi:hypothetical protein
VGDVLSGPELGARFPGFALQFIKGKDVLGLGPVTRGDRFPVGREIVDAASPRDGRGIENFAGGEVDADQVGFVGKFVVAGTNVESRGVSVRFFRLESADDGIWIDGVAALPTGQGFERSGTIEQGRGIGVNRRLDSPRAGESVFEARPFWNGLGLGRGGRRGDGCGGGGAAGLRGGAAPAVGVDRPGDAGGERKRKRV